MILLVATAAAQEGPPLEWSPIVELRARALPSAGLPGGDTLTLGQRARLGIEVQRGWLTARASFQEHRSWTRADDVAEGAFLPSVAEGWARVDAALSDDVGVLVTVGRQPIRIDEGRLVGDRAWEMEGQFLDALRVEARMAPVQFEYVNARRFDAAEGEDPLGFGVNVVRLGLGRDQPVLHWRLDLLSIVDARRTDTTTSTFGGYTRVDAGRLRSTGETYVQSNPDGAGLLLAGSVGWVFGPDEGTLLRSRFTAMSGDPDAAGPRARFRPVLGDTHTFLGAIDLFADGTVQDTVGDGGLVTATLGVETRPWHAFSGKVEALHFSDPSAQAWYGGEVDVSARWWFSPFGSIAGGYAHYEPAPDTAQDRVEWGYLDLDVAF